MSALAWHRSCLGPIEQTVREGDPKHGRKQTHERGGEDGAHLFVGRLSAGGPDLPHGRDRPSKALDPEQQGRPCPDERNGPAAPP